MKNRLWCTRIWVMLLAVALASEANAQALPAFNGIMNKVLGKVIQGNAVRRGFAANDARIAATYTGVGGAAASVAADVAIGAAAAASAPVWLTVAAGAGAALAVGGLVYGAYKIFSGDSSSPAGFTVQKPASSGAAQTPPAQPAIVPATYTPTVSSYEAPSGSAAPPGRSVYTPPTFPLDAIGVPIDLTREYYVKPSYVQGLYVQCNSTEECFQIAIDWYKNAGAVINTQYGIQCGAVGHDNSGAPNYQSCTFQYKMNPDAANWTVGAGDIAFDRNPYYPGAPASEVKGTVADIVSQIPQTELSKDADPETVAQIANSLWQRAAAQPGYQGVPYSAAEPVTAADAAAVKASAPASWPKNVDLVAPVASASGAAVPIGDQSTQPQTDPATQTDPNPTPSGAVQNVNVVNTVKVDWGQVPSVNTPTLENTPTGQMILGPILNLMPSMRNFVVPGHSSQCPTPTVNVFGTGLTLDAHCNLLEGVRPSLFAIMAAVWVMVAALVILRA